MRLDSSPIAALYPGALLFSGIEEDVNDGSLRMYVGPRYVGVHTHVAPGPDSLAITNAWNATHNQHCWVLELDRDVLCSCLNTPMTREDDR